MFGASPGEPQILGLSRWIGFLLYRKWSFMGKFNHRFDTGRPRVAASIERKVRTHRTKGMGIKAIARKLGIGTGTVQRIVAETA